MSSLIGLLAYLVLALSFTDTVRCLEVEIPRAWQMLGPSELKSLDHVLDTSPLIYNSSAMVPTLAGPISWKDVELTTDGLLPLFRAPWTRKSIVWFSSEYSFPEPGFYKVLASENVAVYLLTMVFVEETMKYEPLEKQVIEADNDPRVYVSYASAYERCKYLVFVRQPYGNGQVVPPQFVSLNDGRQSSALSLFSNGAMLPDILMQPENFPEEIVVFAGGWFSLGLSNGLDVDDWKSVVSWVVIRFSVLNTGQHLLKWTVSPKALALVASGQVGQLVLPIPLKLRSDPHVAKLLAEGPCLEATVQLLPLDQDEAPLSSASVVFNCRPALSRFKFTYRPQFEEPETSLSPGLQYGYAIAPLNPYVYGKSCQIPGKRPSRGCSVALVTGEDLKVMPLLRSWVLFVPPSFSTLQQIQSLYDNLVSALPGIPNRLKNIMRISPYSTILVGDRALELAVRFPDIALGTLVTSNSHLVEVELLQNLRPDRVFLQNTHHPNLARLAADLSSTFGLVKLPQTFSDVDAQLQMLEAEEPPSDVEVQFYVTTPRMFGTRALFRIYSKVNRDLPASFRIMPGDFESWVVVTSNVAEICYIGGATAAQVPYFKPPKSFLMCLSENQKCVSFQYGPVSCFRKAKNSWIDDIPKDSERLPSAYFHGGIDQFLKDAAAPVVVYPKYADGFTNEYHNLAVKLSKFWMSRYNQSAVIVSDTSILVQGLNPKRNVILLGGHGVNRLCDSLLSCGVNVVRQESGNLQLEFSSYQDIKRNRQPYNERFPLNFAMQSNSSDAYTLSRNHAMWGYGLLYQIGLKRGSVLSIKPLSSYTSDSVGRAERWPLSANVWSSLESQSFFDAPVEDYSSLVANCTTNSNSAIRESTRDDFSQIVNNSFRFSRRPYLNKKYWKYYVACRLRKILGDQGKRTNYLSEPVSSSLTQREPSNSTLAIHSLPSRKSLEDEMSPQLIHATNNDTARSVNDLLDQNISPEFCSELCQDVFPMDVQDSREGDSAQLLHPPQCAEEQGELFCDDDLVDHTANAMDLDATFDEATAINTGPEFDALDSTQPVRAQISSEDVKTFDETAQAWEKVERNDDGVAADSLKLLRTERSFYADIPRKISDFDMRRGLPPHGKGPLDVEPCAYADKDVEITVEDVLPASSSIEKGIRVLVSKRKDRVEIDDQRASSSSAKVPSSSESGARDSIFSQPADRGILSTSASSKKKGANYKTKGNTKKRHHKRGVLDYLPERMRNNFREQLRDFADRALMLHDIDQELEAMDETFLRSDDEEGQQNSLLAKLRKKNPHYKGDEDTLFSEPVYISTASDKLSNAMLSQYYYLELQPNPPNLMLDVKRSGKEGPKFLVITCWSSRFDISHDSCDLQSLVEILTRNEQHALQQKEWSLIQTFQKGSSLNEIYSGYW